MFYYGDRIRVSLYYELDEGGIFYFENCVVILILGEYCGKEYVNLNI